ncbi:MAG TPA: hypothetical protein VGE62_01065 [Candidatus Paceibacterota bacterium]
MKYTTPLKIEEYMMIEIEPSFEPVVERWIEAVSRMMDKYTNRTLVADPADVTRYFNGDGKDVFFPDDILSITELKVGDEYGDNLVAVTGYGIYPKGGNEPVRQITLRSGSFTKGLQNIELKGKFGLFIETPADIELCATMLTAEIIKPSLPKVDTDIKSESIGNYSVTYTDIKSVPGSERFTQMLDPYKLITL